MHALRVFRARAGSPVGVRFFRARAGSPCRMIQVLPRTRGSLIEMWRLIRARTRGFYLETRA